jgi:adenosylcobinamide-GDP ribazoletransferase
VKHELSLFFVALQFLTRVPVPRWVGFEPAWLQTCLRHFPLVGACIGAWAAVVLWASLQLWPPAVAAVVSTVATLWLTGAFHEDGLADTFDALGGTMSRERALEIMKDSRIGSYGAAALVLMLLLKVSVLAALVVSAGALQAGVALVWAHAVSRAAPVWLVATLRYAGDAEHAKAKPLATQITRAGTAVAGLWVVLLSAAAVALTLPRPQTTTHGFAVPLALLAVVLTTWACARWLQRRLGGFTGDTLGATQQLAEAAALLAWLASIGAAQP